VLRELSDGRRSYTNVALDDLGQAARNVPGARLTPRRLLVSGGEGRNDARRDLRVRFHKCTEEGEDRVERRPGDQLRNRERVNVAEEILLYHREGSSRLPPQQSHRNREGLREQ
jgi:hypothetical protein